MVKGQEEGKGKAVTLERNGWMKGREGRKEGEAKEQDERRNCEDVMFEGMEQGIRDTV